MVIKNNSRVNRITINYSKSLSYLLFDELCIGSYLHLELNRKLFQNLNATRLDLVLNYNNLKLK